MATRKKFDGKCSTISSGQKDSLAWGAGGKSEIRQSRSRRNQTCGLKILQVRRASVQGDLVREHSMAEGAVRAPVRRGRSSKGALPHGSVWRAWLFIRRCKR